MKVPKSVIVALPIVVGIITSVIMYFVAFEFSVIPVGFTVSFLMCGMFLKIDKYWFRSVDTINLLKENPNLYFKYMVIYATLIVIGWLLAFLFNHF